MLIFDIGPLKLVLVTSIEVLELVFLITWPSDIVFIDFNERVVWLLELECVG
jgi:hypothetical protein